MARSSTQSKRSWRLRWGRRLLLLFVSGLLISWLPVLVLRFVDPPTSSFMLQAAAAVPSIDYRWVDRANISAHMQLAVIAAEDQHFPDHAGFDLAAIEAVLKSSGSQGRGASTISQQVAKNLFLWSGRSLFRKGLEAWFTGMIELTWSKSRILEVYLNIAEFGPGIYGVEAASQRYFDRPARALSAEQAASLAAVLPSPRHYSATQPSAYLRSRIGWIQRQMRQLGGTDYLEQLDD